MEYFIKREKHLINEGFDVNWTPGNNLKESLKDLEDTRQPIRNSWYSRQADKRNLPSVSKFNLDAVGRLMEFQKVYNYQLENLDAEGSELWKHVLSLKGTEQFYKIGGIFADWLEDNGYSKMVNHFRMVLNPTGASNPISQPRRAAISPGSPAMTIPDNRLASI